MSTTYKDAGVNYQGLDAFKRQAQEAAARTIRNIEVDGFREVSGCRGESAYVLALPSGVKYLFHVDEGLGTKNLVGDAMHEATGASYYNFLAQDTVAMIVNDLITLGGLPLSLTMHLQVSSDKWFDDTNRTTALLHGWEYATNLARCAWGGGETPALKGIITDKAASLSGSATGYMKCNHQPFNSNSISDGDKIIFVASSGIHANGLTLARQLATELPNGYLTKLPNGDSFGNTLLKPTYIYVDVIKMCLENYTDLHIHYVVNITGHGWRKLMRAEAPFKYVIHTLPPQLPIFDFIKEHSGNDDKEMYSTFNMGAGFALFVSPNGVKEVLHIIRNKTHFLAFEAGYIEKATTKSVEILPKNIIFRADELQIR